MGDQGHLANFPSWTRISDDESRAGVEARTKSGDYALREHELWWGERYEFLLAKGYRLRSRYKPGWVPQWIGTNIRPIYCIDAHSTKHLHIIDAVRIHDDKPVAIKRINNDISESSIAAFLTSGERVQNPRNHCVRIIDKFSDVLDPGTTFMVMPTLLSFEKVEFFAVSEVVDFMRQTLEALVFIHSQGVAHRDYSDNNIMMDGEPLYPNGFLMANSSFDRSGYNRAVPRRRYQVASVKYYTTDFGLSTRFDESDTARLVTGTFAQDPDVPELSNIVPYDPFLVDVFTLGNVFKRNFVQRYSNLAFMEHLVDRMTSVAPSSRPSAEEALRTFEDIISQLNTLSLYRGLRRTAVRQGISIRDAEIILTQFKRTILYILLRPVTLASIFAITVGGSILSRYAGHGHMFSRIVSITRHLRGRS